MRHGRGKRFGGKHQRARHNDESDVNKHVGIIHQAVRPNVLSACIRFKGEYARQNVADKAQAPRYERPDSKASLGHFFQELGIAENPCKADSGKGYGVIEPTSTNSRWRTLLYHRTKPRLCSGRHYPTCGMERVVHQHE